MCQKYSRMKLNTLFFSVCAFFFCGLVRAQEAQPVDWSTLMEISFKDIYLEASDTYVYHPVFTQKQRALDAKRIEVKGYIIPIDVQEELYVLSAFPFSACFFCGNAGPESVMALYFAGEAPSFHTDQRVTLTGTLELNADDPEELIYVLRDAELKP